jgi:hypothetical protein
MCRSSLVSLVRGRQQVVWLVLLLPPLRLYSFTLLGVTPLLYEAQDAEQTSGKKTVIPQCLEQLLTSRRSTGCDLLRSPTLDPEALLLIGSA